MAWPLKLLHILTESLPSAATPALPESPPYQAFVREAAQAQQLWGLQDAAGWVTLQLAGDLSCLPIWSQAQGARLFARGPWAACRVAPIDLTDFLDHWLPAMDRLGVQVAVQPLHAQQLAPVPARVLAWHLQVRCVCFPLSLTGTA